MGISGVVHARCYEYFNCNLSFFIYYQFCGIVDTVEMNYFPELVFDIILHGVQSFFLETKS
jgi:hypothetical protein